MTSQLGIPQVDPEVLEVGGEGIGDFVSLWGKALETEAEENLTRTESPNTILASHDDSIFMSVPADASDPFHCDSAFRRNFIRRHILPMPVDASAISEDGSHSVESLSGLPVEFKKTKGKVSVDGMKVRDHRRLKSGNYLYVVDGVRMTSDEVIEAITTLHETEGAFDPWGEPLNIPPPTENAPAIP